MSCVGNTVNSASSVNWPKMGLLSLGGQTWNSLLCHSEQLRGSSLRSENLQESFTQESETVKYLINALYT